MVWEDATERGVYLPRGASWTAVWSGDVFAGGQLIVVKTPVDEIPVFARDGRNRELFPSISS